MSENEAQTDIEVVGKPRIDRIITWGVLAVIGAGILTFAAHDQFFEKGARRDLCLSSCIANLKTIEGAKSTWALEKQKDSNATPTDTELFGAGQYLHEKPECPGGGIYKVGKISDPPRCSIRDHTL